MVMLYGKGCWNFIKWPRTFYKMEVTVSGNGAEHYV